MARPFKSPNGIYWLRKRVPDALRPLVGKQEVKQSLGTRDPVEAKRLHAEALAQLERQWANLLKGPRTLSEREAHAIAVPIETWFVTQHADNPSRQTLWDPALGADLWSSASSSPAPSSSNTALLTFDMTFMQRRPMQEWCLTTADACLQTQGLQVDEAGRLLLAEAIARAMQRGAETLQRYSRGDYGHAATVSDRPIPLNPSPRASVVTSGAVVTFRALAKGWIKERQPAEKTRYTFPRVLDELATFLGHDDATRVTGEDLVRWKETLLDQGLAGSTIRNGKLGPVRTILQWGVDNKRLLANAATRIGVSTKAKASEGKIPFSEAEASLILGAAAAERDPVYRWVPWLCAYTGARVHEICQLRREDVVERDGIQCLHFTPEAGSLKTRSSERFVPLHPAVIEAGFLTFAEGIRSGPLFPDLKPDRFGSRGGNGSKLLGRWVRRLGIDNPRLQPNHAWRHRMKTLFRRCKVPGDLGRALLGHAAADVSDAYGDKEIPVLYREIEKLPAVIPQATVQPNAGRHRIRRGPQPQRSTQRAKRAAVSRRSTAFSFFA